MFLALSFAYLVGSIPFGKLLTKFLTNKDITKTGSGNIGATNVYRSVSKKAGVAVLLLDCIKPIIVLSAILYISPENYFKYKYLIFLFAIIGHIFPIWLNFKGGKGVACYFGGSLFLLPIPTILAMIIWLFTVKLSKLSSLGALLSIFLLTIYQLVFIYGNLEKVLAFVIFLLIFFKHGSNIKRLIKGEENKINL